MAPNEHELGSLGSHSSLTTVAPKHIVAQLSITTIYIVDRSNEVSNNDLVGTEYSEFFDRESLCVHLCRGEHCEQRVQFALFSLIDDTFSSGFMIMMTVFVVE